MSEQPSNTSMRFGSLIAIEGGILALALLLTWLFGLSFAGQWDWSLATINLAVLATVPLILMAWRGQQLQTRWVNDLQQVTDTLLLPALRQAPPGGLLLLAALAGIGEEWLFRGVIQGGLSAWLSPTAALLIAALLFGLAHAINLAYFVAATLAGLYLGLLYQWSGNLLLPVLVHALYDYAVCLMLLRRR